MTAIRPAPNADMRRSQRPGRKPRSPAWSAPMNVFLTGTGCAASKGETSSVEMSGKSPPGASAASSNETTVAEPPKRLISTARRMILRMKLPSGIARSTSSDGASRSGRAGSSTRRRSGIAGAVLDADPPREPPGTTKLSRMVSDARHGLPLAGRFSRRSGVHPDPAASADGLRRPSIGARTPAKTSRGSAASADWRIAQRAWRPSRDPDRWDCARGASGTGSGPRRLGPGTARQSKERRWIFSGFSL